MTKAEARERTYHTVVHICRFQHQTGTAYADQVGHFVEFCQRNKPVGTNEQKVVAWLEYRAPHCAASTQKVILCALLFFFKEVIKKPLGDLGPWARAKAPKRLPVWYTQAEVSRLLALTPGTFGLMASLCYGAGLRLMECMRLRTQHIDLDKRMLFVIGGKGDKDRVVKLPDSLVARLADHLQRTRALWEGDAKRGLPPVYLPNGLERKYPNAGREWAWFWAFPAKAVSVDPVTKITRRHHVHSSGLQKSLVVAGRQAGIGKRIKVHSLRHSFATHHIEQGTDVYTLKELLGHSHIETTAIYLHCVPDRIVRTSSPLDSLPGHIETFPQQSHRATA